jgi:ABC-type multidrug transport system fused ATPase/permease subunit
MRQILYFTRKLHKFSGKLLYINLIGMVMISLLEGVGIFLIVPLIGSAGILNVNLGEIQGVSWLFTFFMDLPNEMKIPIILSIYIFLVIGQSIFQQKQMMLNIKIHQGFIGHLREETYKTILHANWSFFLKKRKTDIINTMTSELNRVSGGTNMFLQFITSIIFTLIQVGIALWISTFMTLFVLFFGISLMFLSKKFIKDSNEVGQETIELSQSYLSGITDHFNGIKEIKSNTLENSHIGWIQVLSRKIENNIIQLVKIKTNSQLLFKVVSAFLTAAFIYSSIQLLGTKPTQLVLIFAIFSRLWPRISGIQANLEYLGSIIPSLKVLMDLEEECQLSSENLKQVGKKLIIQEGLECQNVSFRYFSDNSAYALHNIDLKIPANKMTAIVGPSGAGKSTLIDILMGLNIPEEGSVLIDDQFLTSDNLLSLRKSISYVPQDPFLFNSSIRENLCIIKKDATEKEIWEALEFAVAAEFVRKLPNGLDTIIGDRGIRLSGGERQRIVLARAILRNPSILVLDEATSALDTENEKKIQAALERLKGKMTIIVIAHRISTIRNADQVIVLNDGKIIQSGEYDQLANEKRGMFSTLLGKQVEAVQ